MQQFELYPQWNQGEQAIDWTVAESDFTIFGLYEKLHAQVVDVRSGDGLNKSSIAGIFQCGNCEPRNTDIESGMPRSQVEHPWFVGIMTSGDPMLIRCQCKILADWMRSPEGRRGVTPPCLYPKTIMKLDRGDIRALPVKSVVVSVTR